MIKPIIIEKMEQIIQGVFLRYITLPWLAVPQLLSITENLLTAEVSMVQNYPLNSIKS